MTDTKPFPSRRTTAACLVAAGLFVLAGFAVTPWESEQTTRAYHDSLAAHEGQAQIAAALLHLGYLLIAPAVLGMLVLIARAGRRGGLFKSAAVLSAVGMTTLPGLLITDAYDLAMARELPRRMSVEVSDRAAELPLASLITVPAVLGVTLGMILASVALWRAGEVPVAVPALVAAGWIVPFAGFNLVLMLTGAALLFAGMTLAAVRIARPAAQSSIESPSPGLTSPVS